MRSPIGAHPTLHLRAHHLVASSLLAQQRHQGSKGHRPGTQWILVGRGSVGSMGPYTFDFIMPSSVARELTLRSRLWPPFLLPLPMPCAAGLRRTLRAGSPLSPSSRDGAHRPQVASGSDHLLRVAQSTRGRARRVHRVRPFICHTLQTSHTLTLLVCLFSDML